MLLALALVAVACSGRAIDVSAVPELPVTDPDHMTSLLAASERPVVLNVWASWCIPCRSEAPLLETANDRFGADVAFVGVNVRDSQDGARAFIAEFGDSGASEPIQHYFDRAGDVPNALGGGGGVPLTFFFAPSGELVKLHHGVIDERTLALQISEILER